MTELNPSTSAPETICVYGLVPGRLFSFSIQLLPCLIIRAPLTWPCPVTTWSSWKSSGCFMCMYYSSVLPHVTCVLRRVSPVCRFVTLWAVAARLLSPGDSPGRSTGVSWDALLQGIFLTQGSTPHLLNCRWILYWLSQVLMALFS